MGDPVGHWDQATRAVTHLAEKEKGHMNTLLIEEKAGTLSVFREGGDRAILQQHARPDTRAYIHPIGAPDGKGILTEDTPAHHPWQHGLYVGLNDVNGFGYWMEGLHKDHLDTDGTFHPHPLSQVGVQNNRASWTVVSDWRDPREDLLLIETQTWTLTDHDRAFHLDLTWSLSAEKDITFGAYAYGGLFLRMPFHKERGGEALNSEGQTNQDAETQRARWVSVSMPIEGRNDWAGIAMFDHPGNPGFPNPWRVDGQLGIAPSRCLAGPWSLRRQESTTSRYRLYLFTGRTVADQVEDQWQLLSKG
jgi:hypothetical protein